MVNLLLLRLGVFAIIAMVVIWIVMAIRSGGITQCEHAHAITEAAAAQVSQQKYLAAKTLGNQLSTSLATTQQKLQGLEREYTKRANNISGTCPDDLRLLIKSAAAGESLPVPDTASSPADEAGTATADAAEIAENISVNYPRCHACIAQLNALIDFHEHKTTD